MAAYDIKKQLKGLRVDSGRRNRRRDPFATGFEDDSDSDEKTKTTSATTRAPPVEKPVAPAKPGNDSEASPFANLDAALRDDDDDFLKESARKDRRPSPAPPQLQSARVTEGATKRRGSLSGKAPRSAIALAAGDLAYLDESEDDEALTAPKRTDRRPSPAPRKTSDPPNPGERSSTPRGSREAPTEQSLNRLQPSRHTVASPFAGTKYLEDSESSSDEDAVSSRQGSTDSGRTSSPSANADLLSPYESALPAKQPKHPEVKRVDKVKQNGSGVSWRAFSASRTEQRNAELEAIQAQLRRRGKSIAFGTHAITDDGKKIPIARPTTEQIFAGDGGGRGRQRGRGKSPPRRAADVQPTEDELVDGGSDGKFGVYDPTQFKTNPFSGQPVRRTISNPDSNKRPIARGDLPDIHINDVAIRDDELQSPHSPTDTSAMTDSADSILSKLVVSPQTIPEGKVVGHSVSPITSPSEDIKSPLSRDSSLRLGRRTASRPTRITNARRSSRRSTSANTSVSPAQAFLSSWSRAEGTDHPVVEPKPDDEGQAIGMNNEYIIGRKINQGGFGVIREVHTITEAGVRLVHAVKIVRKDIPNKDARGNESAQQELDHEVSVWRHLNHPHILKLHAVYDTDFATFCVMDLNVGGTLHDVVRESRASATARGGSKGLPPNLAKSYAYQLASALRYLHEDIRVCHRDVKLENCLIDITGSDTDNVGNLRLCDFGLADFLHGENSIDDMSPTTQQFSLGSPASESSNPTASSIIGTLEYASPKGLSVNRKLFETAGDVWAFGVVVYALCTGDLPFRHQMPSKTVDLILQADWDAGALKHAAAGSDAVIELVKGCLEKDIDLRLTIGEALRSTWFEGFEGSEGEAPNGIWG